MCLSAFALTALAASAQDPTPTPMATPQPTPQPTPIPGAVVPPAVLPDDPPPVAPNFTAPIRPMPGTERVGVDVTDQLPLTLAEAIELALKNNNDIDASRNDVRIAEFNLKGARGVYDPLIDSETYYESLTTPTASLIGGAVNGAVTLKRLFSSSGVSGFSPWMGGTYTARFDSSRTNTSNTNAFLNPQYPTVLNFTYTQPLLRNFGIDNNRRQIEIAKRNLGMSDAQFRQRAIDVIALVEQAYWNLAFALRNLAVQIDAVKQARTQLESNQRQVEKGVIAPIDIVAATAQITNYEQLVYAAQEEVTRSENSLKTLMLADRTAPQWFRPLTPVSPITLEPPKIGLSIATTEAMKNRPEIAQLESSAAINKIEQDYFRNQTKPQIDLVGSYTSQGLTGSVTPNGTGRVPENLIGGYGSSIGNLIAQDYPSYRFGVTIQLPWGNNVAKANYGRSLVQEDRIANQRAQTEQVIEAEVRNALQALRSAEARLASAIAARQAAEELAASEQRQFRSGTTTFYLVQQRQTDLLTARSQEVRAQTDLNKAISEFQRATGTTLSANNVTVSDNKTLTLTNRGSKLAFNAPFFVRDARQKEQ
ncbi:MAG TPA: TolC family protein [Pyrinomonadaceae bacterium]|nr:TolC family protein [Pyrinomonadaceae bacterium]